MLQSFPGSNSILSSQCGFVFLDKSFEYIVHTPWHMYPAFVRCLDVVGLGQDCSNTIANALELL